MDTEKYGYYGTGTPPYLSHLRHNDFHIGSFRLKLQTFSKFCGKIHIIEGVPSLSAMSHVTIRHPFLECRGGVSKICWMIDGIKLVRTHQINLSKSGIVDDDNDNDNDFRHDRHDVTFRDCRLMVGVGSMVKMIH